MAPCRLRGWRRHGRRADVDVASTSDQSEPVTQARFGGDDDRSGEWVTVFVAGTIEEAHVIRGALEAEGIPVLLRNQALSRLYGPAAMWGVDVRVPAPLETRARELID